MELASFLIVSYRDQDNVKFVLQNLDFKMEIVFLPYKIAAKNVEMDFSLVQMEIVTFRLLAVLNMEIMVAHCAEMVLIIKMEDVR